MTFNKFFTCYWPALFAAVCLIVSIVLAIVKQDTTMYIITGVIALIFSGMLWLGIAKDRDERKEGDDGKSEG